MKKWGIVIGLLAAPLLATPAMTVQAAEGTGIQWVKSVDEANEQAKATGKLIMADFYTDWCGYCKKLDKETFPDARVALLSEEFVPIKVNAERGRGPELAKEYGVSGFPNIIFLDTEGTVVHKIGGYMPADGYAREMARILQKSSESRMKKEASAGDVGSLTRLSVMYAVLGDADKASSNLSKAEKANAKAADPKKNGGRLAAAYLALGDYYMAESDYDNAIGVFQKVPAVADDAGDLMMSRLKLAFCYIQNGDVDKATTDLNAILSSKDATAEEKRIAQDLLEKAKK